MDKTEYERIEQNREFWKRKWKMREQEYKKEIENLMGLSRNPDDYKMIKDLFEVAFDLRTYRDGTAYWNEAVMKLEQLEKKFKCSST